MAVVDILKYIITADNAGLKKAMAEGDAAVGASVKKIDNFIGTITGGLAGIATAIGVGALAAVFSKATGEFQGFAKAVDELTDRFDLTAEEASQFVAAAQHVGTTAQDLIFAFEALNRRVTGTGDATEQLGADATGARRILEEFRKGAVTLEGGLKPLPEVIRVIQDMMGKVETQSEKSAIGMALLGRSSGRLIDFFQLTGQEAEELRQKVRALGLELSSETVKKAEIHERKISDLRLEWQAFGRELADWGKLIGDVFGWILRRAGEAREGIQVTAENLAGLIRMGISGELGRRIMGAPPMFVPPPLKPLKTISTRDPVAKIKELTDAQKRIIEDNRLRILEIEVAFGKKSLDVLISALRARLALITGNDEKELKERGDLESKILQLSLTGVEKQKKTTEDRAEHAKKVNAEILDNANKTITQTVDGFLREFGRAEQLGEENIQGLIDQLTTLRGLLVGVPGLEEATSNIDEVLKDLFVKLKRHNIKLADDTEAKWRTAFHSLLNNIRNLGNALGRFLGQGVSNFLNTMLDAIEQIRASLASLKVGGLLGTIGGAAGIAGAVLGVIGGIADLFSGGANAIVESQTELIHTIRDWIKNIRQEPVSTMQARKEQLQRLLQFQPQLSQILQTQGLGAARAFAERMGIGEVFSEAFAQLGTNFDEAARQMLVLLERELDLIVKAGGGATSQEVLDILKGQTDLDFTRGRSLIESFARLNNFSLEEQLDLFRQLQKILGSNMTEDDALAMAEAIKNLKDQIAEGTQTGQETSQIVRSVTTITEQQGNLVVGFLSTINAVLQEILAVLQGAFGGGPRLAFGAAGAGAGAYFAAGAISIYTTAQGGEQLAREFQDALRQKGVQV